MDIFHHFVLVLTYDQPDYRLTSSPARHSLNQFLEKFENLDDLFLNSALLNILL